MIQWWKVEVSCTTHQKEPHRLTWGICCFENKVTQLQHCLPMHGKDEASAPVHGKPAFVAGWNFKQCQAHVPDELRSGTDREKSQILLKRESRRMCARIHVDQGKRTPRRTGEDLGQKPESGCRGLLSKLLKGKKNHFGKMLALLR